MTPHEMLESIRAYTAEHDDLRRAHHFLFDLPLESDRPVEFVVMGVNPGLQKGDWTDWPTPTEETREFDFREVLRRERRLERPAASRRWRTATEAFCGTANVTMSELFFWSSKSLGADFIEAFGARVERCRHIGFCFEMNRALVRHYQPRAVIAPGLACHAIATAAGGVESVATIRDPLNGHRLVEHCELDGVPWFVTKHWSGAFGFSRAQRDRVREYIHNALLPA